MEVRCKVCFKCGESKPLSDFYRHQKMADGHVNKCKECNKRDVRENRKLKVDYYREYDKARGNRQTQQYRDEYREKYPKKYFAVTSVNNAVRDGRLSKHPCEVCGDLDVHGHHDDYDKPLDVRWLCPAHHKAWHDLNGEGANAHTT